MKFRLLGGVKRIKKEINKSLRRLTAHQQFKPLVAQMLVVSLFFSTVPINAFASDGTQVKLAAYNFDATTLSFDAKQAEPIVLAQPEKISFQLGQSRDEETQRVQAAAANRAQRATNTMSFSTMTLKTAEPDLSGKRALAQRAAATYGVPWEIVEAVWQIESGKSWDTTVHSSAGAQGPAQFMPGTWRAYGVDADGDGVANIHGAEDAVYTAAHYLAANGADQGEVYQALFAYNHADWYVQKVLGVARSIGYQG